MLLLHVVSSVFLKAHLIRAVTSSCVLQGEKGIGLAGPPGRVGPQGLKVSSTGFCVGHQMCHRIRI